MPFAGGKPKEEEIELEELEELEDILSKLTLLSQRI
jgi:hypothetical protein